MMKIQTKLRLAKTGVLSGINKLVTSLTGSTKLEANEICLDLPQIAARSDVYTTKSLVSIQDHSKHDDTKVIESIDLNNINGFNYFPATGHLVLSFNTPTLSSSSIRKYSGSAAAKLYRLLCDSTHGRVKYTIDVGYE